MKILRSLSVLLVIAASSSYAMAEGGGDRTFARMEQARQEAVANYQADQKGKVQAVASKANSQVKNHKC